MPPQQSQSSLSVPVAIVIAGALIAAAVYFSNAGGAPTVENPKPGTNPEEKEVPAVVASEHILGNPNAQVKIVEYTDLECPFCKQFHDTMKRVMEKYGPDGKVAWVMRNFPLSQLHPNAPSLALAAECVAELGGNSAYWKFLDEIFRRAPINTQFDFAQMDAAVGAVAVNTTQFKSCFESEKHAAKIEKEFNDAVASGGRGTPFNILVKKDGTNVPIEGSQPYEVVVAAIEDALK